MTINFQSLSPILPVEAIEPCLSFWTEKLGFNEVAKVPDDGPLAFAMLSSGPVTVMYQTHASIAEADPALAKRPLGNAALYIKVDDVKSIVDAVGDSAEVLAEPHESFYGMLEVTFREPGGHVITFAQSLASDNADTGEQS